MTSASVKITIDLESFVCCREKHETLAWSLLVIRFFFFFIIIGEKYSVRIMLLYDVYLNLK